MDGSSADRVGRGIERLEDRFGSFPVNQTTLTVTGSDFETLRERAGTGLMDVYVRVRNDAGDVLHVPGSDERTVPWCVSDPDDGFPACVRDAVRGETGVACRIDDVVRATIAGVRREDAAAESAVYRLVVLVDATHERGTPEEGAWETGDPALPEYV